MKVVSTSYGRDYRHLTRCIPALMTDVLNTQNVRCNESLGYSVYEVYMKSKLKLMHTIVFLLLIFGGIIVLVFGLAYNSSRKADSSYEFPIYGINDIEINEDGDIYLGVEYFNRIQIYNRDGDFKEAIPVNTSGFYNFEFKSGKLYVNRLNVDFIDVYNLQNKNTEKMIKTDTDIEFRSDSEEVYKDITYHVDVNQVLIKYPDSTTNIVFIRRIWPNVVTVGLGMMALGFAIGLPYMIFEFGIIRIGYMSRKLP